MSAWTAREAATQVARPGIFLDDDRDREMVAGPYTPSEVHHQCASPGLGILTISDPSWATNELQSTAPKACGAIRASRRFRVPCKPLVCLRLLFASRLSPSSRIPLSLRSRRRVDATVVIQRYARGWSARKIAMRLAWSKMDRDDFAQDAQEREADVLLRTQQRELQRRLRPRTKKDFAKLHKELEIWHTAESTKIAAADMDPAAAAAARIALLARAPSLARSEHELTAPLRHNARNPPSPPARRLRLVFLQIPSYSPSSFSTPFPTEQGDPPPRHPRAPPHRCRERGPRRVPR